MQVSNQLLAVSPAASAELTTIYVKYTTTQAPTAPAYAVVWLKTSKQFVVGLALPEDVQHPALCAAPAGMMYKGLTKYLVVKPGDTIPEDVVLWARLAYETALTD